MTIMSILTKGHSLTSTLPDILANNEMGDWWKNIVGVGKYAGVKYPTVHLAAWWDIFQGQHIETFNGFWKEGDKKYRDSHRLIVSPLGHCLIGNIDPYYLLQDTKALINGYGYSSELFDEMSKHNSPYGKGHYADKLKRINIYVQGATYSFGEKDYYEGGEVRKKFMKGKEYGHFWSSFDEWPEPKEFKLYITS